MPCGSTQMGKLSKEEAEKQQHTPKRYVPSRREFRLQVKPGLKFESHEMLEAE